MKTFLKNESKDDLVFNLDFSLLGFHLIVQSRTSKKHSYKSVIILLVKVDSYYKIAPQH